MRGRGHRIWVLFLGFRDLGFRVLILLLPSEGPSILTIMELGPERPSLLWLQGLDSVFVVYEDPLGYEVSTTPLLTGPGIGPKYS